MQPALQGYADAVLGPLPPDRLAEVVDELRAVDHLVLDNDMLHSALTDTSVPGGSRRAVLEELLEDRVSPEARLTAGFAVSVVRATDVPAALGWLVARARHAAEGVIVPEVALGHLAARERVGGFAAAVFEDCTVEDLEAIEDGLFRFARIAESSGQLRGVLTDRDVPAGTRRDIVHQLLSGKVATPALRLAEYVVTGGRPRDFVGTLDWLVEHAAGARGWRVARVRSAHPISAEQQERLARALSAMAGGPVELEVTLDGGLLGGAVIELGDTQIDASARGRLDRLREHLLPDGGWEDKTGTRPSAGAA